MEELYAELLIQRKPMPLLKVIKVLVIVAAVLLVGGGMFFSSLFFIAAALIAVYYWVLPLFDVEYEYLIVNNEIDVDCIYARNKRKKMMSAGFDKMEILAPLDSHRLDSYKNVEVVDFSANDKNRKPYVMVAMSKSGLRKILLQLDEATVENMKNHMPGKVFSD